MSKILVTYYSKSGNTKKMAELLAEGVSCTGAGVDVRPTVEVDVSELLNYQGYIIGSPVYYGMPAAEIKHFFDESVTLHGRLAGRAGAAFASSANVGGGNETTCLAIIQMMMVHGMVTIGSSQGDHYGPCSINAPDARVAKQCHAHGERVARLVLALEGAELK